MMDCKEAGLQHTARYFFILPVILVVMHMSFQASAQAISGVYAAPAVSFTADWISCPGESMKDYGVFYLRKIVDLRVKPSQFIIHVSGDQRYRLLVNGKQACFGPARGDLRNWNFETIDIAPLLKEGKNILAAQLWNMGSGAPAAQISYQTAFILQGNSALENLVNTNNTWRVTRNKGYFPEPFPASRLQSYIAGSCDSVDFRNYPFGWERLDFNDSNWLSAGIEPKARYYNEKRRLVPRSIPMMEEQEQAIDGIVRTEGIDTSVIKSFASNGSFNIPPHTNAVILFDIKDLTTAYPEIRFSKGGNSKVKITYAESLFDTNNLKGNRNEVNGKRIKGYYDVFLPDGGPDRLFRPLWIRTFRYIQFDISTDDEPLLIDRLTSVFTAYPFVQKGSFTSDNAMLADIWKVGWRTARLCAGETYMDCPYYEQLQYEGDTRIQALISLYISGDDRLMRNAIAQFHQSQIPDGLTADAYPAGNPKIIPPFSLFWISMLHDYYLFRDDRKFINKYLIPAEAILKWFEEQIDTRSGMLGKPGYWNFVDWSFPKQGIPPGGLDGNSAILSLQYAYTLDQAAELFTSSGSQQAAAYRSLSHKIKKAVYAACYDGTLGLLADSPDKNSFSQHANIWGILTDCIPLRDQKDAMVRIMNDTSLTQASLYFRFYFTRAMVKAGMGNRYISTLQPWQQMLALGLSTFPETGAVNVRSDCHAWSASPCYDLLATICGVNPGSPGFRSVRIEPNPGDLQNVAGEIAHPKGNIKVSYKKQPDGSFLAAIELPGDLNGRFIYKGKMTILKSGKQTFRF